MSPSAARNVIACGVWMMLRALHEPSSNGKTRAQVGATTSAVEAREGGSGRCGDGEKVRTGIVFVAMAQSFDGEAKGDARGLKFN